MTEIPPQGALDRLDGAALRRLREAMPEGSWFDVKSPTFARRGWHVVEFRSGDRMYEEWYHGDTIAEAAIKCRLAIQALITHD